MSLIVSKSIWAHSKQSGTSLVMLLALAESANDYGEAHPGMAYLAAKCRMSVRNAQLQLRQLEAAGEIEIVLQGGEPTATGRTNLYIVKTPDLMRRQGVKPSAPLASTQGVKDPVPRGERSGIQGVKPSAPKPSNETVLTEINDGEARERKNGTPPAPPLKWIFDRLGEYGITEDQVGKVIAVFKRVQHELTPSDMDRVDLYLADPANKVGILLGSWLYKGKLPPVPRLNGYTNGYSHTNGRSPPRSPPPDFHEERDDAGNVYLVRSDGTRMETEL